MTRTLTAALLAAALALGVVLGRSFADSPASADLEPQEPAVDRTVVVVDHTGGEWVGLASNVAAWSRSPLVDLVVKPRCDLERYCVVLKDPYPWGRKWIGYWTPVSRHVSEIDMDSTDNAGPVVQSWTLCHEIGHALGVDHVRKGAPACMINDPDQGVSGPTQRDFDLLAQAQATGQALDGSALRFIYGD